jgi:hypothetical protein
MQGYLFIGGAHDGLNFLVQDGQDEAHVRVSVAGFEVYFRDTLAIGGAAIVVFRHKSLTPAQALDRFVSNYKACCEKSSRGRTRRVRPLGESAAAKVSEFTKEQLETVRAFLAQVRERAKPAREKLQECHQSRWKGDALWSEYGLSRIDAQTAVWWYLNRHKLGSTQWRPHVILRALVLASERDYVELERLPVDERVLKATPADKRNARAAFIRKHGVAAFYQKVNPILANGRGGVRGLFEIPVTPEIREYVAILAKIVGKQKPVQSPNDLAPTFTSS